MGLSVRLRRLWVEFGNPLGCCLEEALVVVRVRHLFIYSRPRRLGKPTTGNISYHASLRCLVPLPFDPRQLVMHKHWCVGLTSTKALSFCKSALVYRGQVDPLPLNAQGDFGTIQESYPWLYMAGLRYSQDFILTIRRELGTF